NSWNPLGYLPLFIVFAELVDVCFGHGRLVNPPSRSSMWRYGFSNPPNYNDNQLYCGGVQIQYEVNKGKCGVCGDPYQGPLDNEPGGKYANGIIVKTYTPADVIPVEVEITAPHKGYMEFRLCPNDDPNERITQECLDDYVLHIVETDDTRYPVSKSGRYKMKVRLPHFVKCRNCVFQWKYNTGNSWGVDPVTKRGCVGCGNQEQFYGCADIAIGHDDIQVGQSLKNNRIMTGRPLVSDGMPTPPMIPPDVDDWGDVDDSKEVEVVTQGTDGQTQTNDGSYRIYKSFLDFQNQFQNKNVRPCVCHTCVGQTCVCECFSSDAAKPSGNDVISMLAMTIASLLAMNFSSVF
ncbi:hypothetical protein FSP39_014004, partial [Pinctada imbricata]